MAIGLKTQIWNNNLRSLILLAAYPLVLIGMLWAAGVAIGEMSGPGYGYRSADPIALGNQFVDHYWPTVVTVVTIWFVIAWFFQTGMIRMVSHSQPVTRQEEPELYNLLENLCISRGLKMPKLEIISDPAMNAFASGMSDNTYSITVTRGLLQALKPDELEAVLGHELTHIINRDVRLMMVTVIFTGMIGFAAQMLWSNIRYGLWFGNSRDRRDNGVLLYFAIMIILGIGYLASMLARFAISRRREYMADAGSVELTHNPEAMMRALQRISGQDHIAHVTEDVSMMCTENSRAFLGMFATHPPIESRIRTIAEMTGTPVPGLSDSNAGRANPWA